MSMIIYPRISEKTFALAADENTYVFNVPIDTNKIAVKEAVQSQYDVQVKAVNIVRMKGKATSRLKKSGRRIAGRISDYKKAYVVVAKGQTIPAFSSAEEEK